MHTKASFKFVSLLGIHYLAIQRSCQMHSRLDTPHPKVPLTWMGPISSWQWPSECIMEMECPFQRDFYTGKSICWLGSNSHLVQKALHSFPVLHYILQRLPCLPAGYNSSSSVYSCTAPNSCKPSFLLSVTSHIVAQEPQNLKYRLKFSEWRTFHIEWAWDTPIRLCGFFFFLKTANYIVSSQRSGF